MRVKEGASKHVLAEESDLNESQPKKCKQKDVYGMSETVKLIYMV